MKPLLITLFLIANVIFVTQIGRHLHQFAFGTESSVLDQFDREKRTARMEGHMDSLVQQYGQVNDQIRALESARKHEEVLDVRQQNDELYKKRDALKAEISERESKARELRDLWIYSVFAIALIIGGTGLYVRGMVWPGLGILVTGFGILEYWCSPTFFSGAYAEFHSLLISKIVLTVVAIVLTYGFWSIRNLPNRAGCRQGRGGAA